MVKKTVTNSQNSAADEETQGRCYSYTSYIRSYVYIARAICITTEPAYNDRQCMHPI